MDEAATHADGSARPRKRITKACDQCNRSRSKCDGDQPCNRCRESTLECSYERVSRRHGRVPKAQSRRIVMSNGASSRNEATPTGGGARPNDQMDRPMQMSNPSMIDHGMGLNVTATPSAWFTNDMSYNEIYYNEPNWTEDLWPQHFDGFRVTQSTGPVDSNSQLYSGIGPTSHPSDRTPTAGDMATGSPSQTQKLRFPVLEPVAPFLVRMMSPTLACDLLEAYVADAAEGVYAPSSPLLLAHIFRRETLLSQRKPRKCTPALLASMLLVAAHTTEFPFFGGSPSARDRLHSSLLHLTLALMDKLPDSRKRRPPPSNVRNGSISTRSDSDPGPRMPSFKRPKTAYIDDIATYMHIALVTTCFESKPPGTHWWHTAFQLAKEFKLNRDPSSTGLVQAPTMPAGSTSSPNGTAGHAQSSLEEEGDTSGATSPMSVSDDAIVEHSDPRLVIATTEESEERRRIWWLLYIWDRHLALRYNHPLSIKDAESQDVQLPMDEEVWQAANSPCTSPNAISSYRQRGPPTTIAGHSVFHMLLPLMCILGQIIDMHHVAYHPRVERSSSNPVADAYTAAITQQLAELEPSIATLCSNFDGAPAAESAQGPALIQHYRLMRCHARYLLHLLYSLLGVPLDKLTLVEKGVEHMQSPRFSETLNHSLITADCLNDLHTQGPVMDYNSMFSGIFFYHGATLLWAVATMNRPSDPRVIAACETYVRVFEASNCSYQAEYLRKMRRLLLLKLKEIKYGMPLSKTERHLEKHILKLYRWTGDGTGLGL